MGRVTLQRTISIVLALLAVLLIVQFGFSGVGPFPWLTILGSDAGIQPGNPAPDFELADLSGHPTHLKDAAGRPVVLNFWATWCEPCRQEMPLLDSRYRQSNGRLGVIAVDDDEPAGDVQAYVQELQLSFTVLLDPGETVQKLYRVRGYPTSVFIDSQGVIRAVHIGSLDAAKLEEYLKLIQK